MKFLIVSILVAGVCADVSHIVGKSDEKNAAILKQDLNVGVEGEYSFAYETANGISASAQGALKNVPGAEAPAGVVQGEAKWVSPEGETVQFSYIADENGYAPQGSHIPTSPPIPEAIQRALAFIQAHPPKTQE